MQLTKKNIALFNIKKYLDFYHYSKFSIQPFGRVLVGDCPHCKHSKCTIASILSTKLFWFSCIRCKTAKDSNYFFDTKLPKHTISDIVDTPAFYLGQYLFTHLLRNNLNLIHQLYTLHIVHLLEKPLHSLLFSNLFGSTTVELYKKAIPIKYRAKSKDELRSEDFLSIPLYALPYLPFGYLKYSNENDIRIDTHRSSLNTQTYIMLKFDRIKDMVIYPDIPTMIEEYPKDYLKPSYKSTNYGSYPIA